MLSIVYIKTMKKLSQTGFAHFLIPAVLVIVGVASYGTYRVMNSYADTKAGIVQLNSEQGCWLTGRVWNKASAKTATPTCTKTCRVAGTEFVSKSADHLGYCKGHIVMSFTVDRCTKELHRYYVEQVGCGRKPNQKDAVATAYCQPGYPYYNANYTNEAEDTRSLVDFCEQSKKVSQKNEAKGTPGQASTTPSGTGTGSGSSGGGNGGGTGTGTGGGSGSGSGTTPQPDKRPKITKVLVIIEENHSLEQMSKDMPYAFSLAKKYGYATNYTAITHPSLPNYLAISAGSTLGVTDDADPASHKLTQPSVFKQAIDNKKTAGVFADGMTGNCALKNGGNKYLVRHNPWTYFANERSNCAKYDRPASAFPGVVKAGNLPTVGMLIPNACNDAHDCPLKTADNWFKLQMQTVFAGPDWKSGHLAVVLTADEDDKKGPNTVLTVVMSPSVSAKKVDAHLTHYSLSRLLSEVSGSKPLGNAAGAKSLSGAFNLPL